MRSLPVQSLPVTWLLFMSHPLAMLLPVMHNCTFRTTAMVRKKKGVFYHVCVLTVVFLLNNLRIKWMKWSIYSPKSPSRRSLCIYPGLWLALYRMIRTKARECTSGHVQNILPVMTSLPIMWLPVTSFPVRAASGDVTSSNAYAMARSPLLSPKYSLSCIYRDPPPLKNVQILMLIFDILLWAWGAETHPGT
jgi:hypothetical protein